DPTAAGAPRPRVRADQDWVRDVAADTRLALDFLNEGRTGLRYVLHGDVGGRLIAPPPDPEGPRLPTPGPPTKDGLRHALNAGIDFYDRDIDPKTGAIVYRPAGAPAALVAHLHELKPWPLPEVRRLTTAPVFTAAGDLLDRPGYHAAAKVIYAPGRGLAVPPVPAAPTRA